MYTTYKCSSVFIHLQTPTITLSNLGHLLYSPFFSYFSLGFCFLSLLFFFFIFNTFAVAPFFLPSRIPAPHTPRQYVLFYCYLIYTCECKSLFFCFSFPIHLYLDIFYFSPLFFAFYASHVDPTPNLVITFHFNLSTVCYYYYYLFFTTTSNYYYYHFGLNFCF